MKNWKKIMAMLCVAATLTGGASSVLAAESKDETATEETADEAVNDKKIIGDGDLFLKKLKKVLTARLESVILTKLSQEIVSSASTI
nr:hypothetical protein [uncultured Blautia sp.]